MYARFLSFKAPPEKRKAIEALTDKVYAKAKTLPGFISVLYVASEDGNEYGSVSQWKTLENAEEAAKVLGREFGMQLGDFATGAVDLKLMEVYEPRG